MSALWNGSGDAEIALDCEGCYALSLYNTLAMIDRNLRADLKLPLARASETFRIPTPAAQVNAVGIASTSMLVLVSLPSQRPIRGCAQLAPSREYPAP